MSERLVIDTGPIIAFIDRRDQHHAWATEQFKRLAPPFLTCEPVLAEAFFLASRLAEGRRELLAFLRAGLLQIPFRLMDNTREIDALIAKYADVPMSLADACLVRMVECYPGASILTLDSDFRIYRQHGRRQIPLIIPEDR